MNFNRFSLLCAAALSLTATSVFAQETKPGAPPTAGAGQEAKPKRKGNAMSAKALAEALQLTQEQQDKLKPAFKKAADERKALNTDTALDPKAKRAKGAELTKTLMKSVEEVLTPEQKTKLDEMKKKMAEGAKRKKKDGNS
jgi:Spy/CpxP family protein refolding chaperone